jgi:hypothetical protein
MFRSVVTTIFLLAIHGGSVALAQEDFYTAALVDGQIIEGSHLENWPDSPGGALLDEQPLGTTGTPLRWLRNQRAPFPNDPPAGVEFIGGDQLPGEVVGVRSDEAGLSLTVTPAAETLYPGLGRRTELRIDPGEVQRIVWRRKAGRRFTPGRVFLHDGRDLAFRSLQWKETGITVLTEDGITEFAWSDLSELHLPAADPWQAHVRCLAQSDPQGLTRLKTVETSDGLRVTVSTLWFQSPLPYEQRVAGQTTTAWHHYLRPYWSRDPLWIADAAIARTIFFHPEEYLLSRLEPVFSESPQGFGQSWVWQPNRNVRGETMHNGGRDYAWGFGTHAASRLEFSLVDYAKTFRCRVGLDRLAGSGGCAQAMVYLNGASEPRYTSPILKGSRRAYDLGRIVLSGEPPRTLALASVSAHENRPPGADPFEIRDHVDWLEPIVELDRKSLLAAVSQVLPSETHPVIRDELQALAPGFEAPLPMTLEGVGPEAFKLSRFQAGVPSLLRGLIEVPSGKQTRLVLDVTANTRYVWPLVVMASGKRLWDDPVTKGKSLGNQRWLVEVDLSEFDGQTIAVELYNFGAHSSLGSALWHGVQVVSE